MKRYEVLLSEKASKDMEDIYDYIAKILLAPDTAANQYDRIADAILTLEEMPDRIRIMDSEPERSKGFRPLVVDHYTAVYVIKNDKVYIVRVLYSATDISKHLSDS